MVRRHITALRLGLMSADASSAIVLFVLLSIFRFGAGQWQASWTAVGIDGRLLAVIYGIGWITVLWLLGLYRLRARWSARTEVMDVARAALILAVATFVVLFWLKLPNVSRQFLLLLFPAQVILTVGSRFILRWAFATARARGLNSRYILVVGTGAEAQAFANRIEAHREMGLHVIGHLAAPPAEGDLPIEADAVDGFGAWGARPTRQPILGDIRDIEEVLHSRIVDEVAICLPMSQLALVEPITRLCEDEGRVVRIPTEETGLTMPGARIEDFDGVRVLSLVYGPDRAVALVMKRALDVIVAALALVILSPLVGLLAVGVRVRDGAPVLFRQTRIGEHGRPFKVVKFRTMAVDAEERLSELEALNEIQGHAFKVTHDPRVTRTGRFLRALSLDELPQLWNVLRGEMSLVGPRPPLPREVDGYDIWHRRRLSMKPGITGLWQVAARREPEFDRWVRMDLEYIDRWSLWLDLKIMARTIPAVIGHEGR
ncbi:MAG TPA: sugar transferase [Candidatus Limnocylindrales bacterium]|jgi:exopolysaccharide biosynthesis polyprenyl glycosylphosphotransferase|nr:sugar transferase [Candidatus Limnocylindrales bacterium]